MRLYHYTALGYLDDILEDGRLTLTESNIGAPVEAQRLLMGHEFRSVGEHVGPDVVWMFNTPEPHLGSLESRVTVFGPAFDKRLVRITVEVPDEDAHWWPEWSRQHGIDRPWYDVLAKSGRLKEWVVVTKEIPIDATTIIEVRSGPGTPWMTYTGEAA